MVGPSVLTSRPFLQLQSLHVPAKDALVLLAAVIDSRQVAHHWHFEPNDLQSESSDDMYLMCSAVGVGNAGEFLLDFRR